jgi:hypothetical protein
MGYLNNWLVWLIVIFIILVILCVWIKATATESQNNTPNESPTVTDDSTTKKKTKANNKSNNEISKNFSNEFDDNSSDDSSNEYNNNKYSNKFIHPLEHISVVPHIEHISVVPRIEQNNEHNNKFIQLPERGHSSPNFSDEHNNLPIVSVINKESRQQSKGEAECKKVLDKIYNTNFQVQVRNLPWLKNPKTGRNLELDLYSPELKIACEYHGKQHYQVVKRFHPKGKVDLQYQQWKDNLKYDLCNEAGVYLITVPYTVPLDRIEDFILYFLPEKVQERRNLGEGTLTLTSRY